MGWKFQLLVLAIILVLSVVSAEILWGDYASTDFTTTTDRPICINGEQWKTWDAIAKEYVYTDSFEDCYKPGPPAGYPTAKCCVYGEAACDILSGVCDLEPVLYCENYLDQESCEEPDFGVPEATLERTKGENFCESSYSYINELGETCEIYILECSCKWIDSETGCIGHYTPSDPVCYGDENPEINPGGGCSIDVSEKIDECDTKGFITYYWTAIWEGGNNCVIDSDCEPGYFCDAGLCREEECVDGERKIKCATKLLFFTLTTFLITIMIIVIIYFIKQKRGK